MSDWIHDEYDKYLEGLIFLRNGKPLGFYEELFCNAAYKESARKFLKEGRKDGIRSQKWKALAGLGIAPSKIDDLIEEDKGDA